MLTTENNRVNRGAERCFREQYYTACNNDVRARYAAENGKSAALRKYRYPTKEKALCGSS